MLLFRSSDADDLPANKAITDRQNNNSHSGRVASQRSPKSVVLLARVASDSVRSGWLAVAFVAVIASNNNSNGGGDDGDRELRASK